MGDGGWNYSIINCLPYTMTLTYSATQNPNFNVGFVFGYSPAGSIPPGSVTTFWVQEMWPEGLPVDPPPPSDEWTSVELHYDFTDVNGGKHRCLYTVSQHDGIPYVYSQDYQDGNYVNTTATFEILPGFGQWPYPHGVAAVLTQDEETTIDASQDLAAATSVIANLWPQGTNKDFTATTDSPTFQTGPWTRGSAVVNNATTEPVTLQLQGGDTTSETTSIALTLSWSSSLDILGLVNQSVSASITGGHDWSTSVMDSQSYSVTINPAQKGWLEWAVSSATITGDFTFTWQPPINTPGVPIGKINYHVINATVTEPGRGQDPAVPAITWEPHLESIASQKVIHRPATTRPARASTSRLTGSNPVMIINAATDPDKAADAMKLWPGATNQNFTATSNPMYTSTQPAPLGDSFQVPANWPNPEDTTFTRAQSSESSWSLGGSVGAETTLSALGFANASVSVTFTANHQWTTSHTDTQSITVPVPPGYVSWIEGSTGQVSFTGNYSFTAQGTDYEVNNVTITEPGAADSGPMAAFTYLVVTQKLSSSVAATLTSPRWAPDTANRPDAVE
jgi:hypothetical protein